MTSSDKPTRILVCGSRTFDTGYVINYELDYISHYYNGNVMVIHGGANGADRLGGKWAEANDKTLEVYVADWNQFGKRAGYLRNTRMLEEGRPDRVVAFVDKPLEESKGTKMMVDIARKGGVPCRVVEHRAYVLSPLPDKDTPLEAL